MLPAAILATSVGVCPPLPTPPLDTDCSSCCPRPQPPPLAASVVIFDIHALQERFYFGDQVRQEKENKWRMKTKGLKSCYAQLQERFCCRGASHLGTGWLGADVVWEPRARP